MSGASRQKNTARASKGFISSHPTLQRTSFLPEYLQCLRRIDRDFPFLAFRLLTNAGRHGEKDAYQATLVAVFPFHRIREAQSLVKSQKANGIVVKL